QPRVAIGIEDGAVMSRDWHVRVVDALVDGSEQRKKPGPSGMRMLQVLLAPVPDTFFEFVAQEPGGVGPSIERPVRGKQPAFLGAEKEDDAHHHGDGAAVHLMGGDVADPGATLGDVRGVGASDGGDEQLDGLAYLDAQCLCDVLLAVLARVQEVGQCFSVRDAEESRPAEYGHECAAGIAVPRLVPVDRVEDGGCGDAAARGPDEGPPAS